jgi:hypothetical protein
VAKVPAGTWHCILDAIIIADVSVTFDLIWRRGSDDTVLAEWNDTYQPSAGGIDAQPFEYDETAQAIDTIKGDQLVFRYTANASSPTECYIPNGDGALEKGRIPNFTLPK